MTRVKLKEISFPENGIRKLKNLTISFASRITLIAGHNGTGKSTILGLLASASGTDDNNYLNRKFRAELNEIIHFDISELGSNLLSAPWPKLIYEVDNTDEGTNTDTSEEHWKNIRITKRNDQRLRSVATTHPNSPNTFIANNDQKVPLPTIYLGMLRMLPIGESSESDITNKEIKIDDQDANLLQSFINKVISNSATTNNISEQGIKNTKKHSKHPTYNHSSKAISLGQDSLSSIATAIASFNKLSRDMGNNYVGGLLVIDEIDACLHPKAQQKLITALREHARQLNLQIIATTHSVSLIDFLHPNSKNYNNRYQTMDSVIYLGDTASPQVVDWSLDKILSDMSLSSIDDELTTKADIPIIKAYLEDEEALKFAKGILEMTNNSKTFTQNQKKVKLSLVPIGIGGSNLINLPKHDDYFKKTLLLVDADTTKTNRVLNAIKLPSASGNSNNPEKNMYFYIQEISKANSSKYKQTYTTLLNNGITSDRLREEFLSDDININQRESSKKWFQKKYDKFINYKLFKYWANDHKIQIDQFKNELQQKLFSLANNQ